MTKAVLDHKEAYAGELANTILRLALARVLTSHVLAPTQIMVLVLQQQKPSLGWSALKKTKDEPTWRCHQNPFIGALGILEPVVPGEPLIEG